MLRKVICGVVLLIPHVLCAQIIETKTLKDVLNKTDKKTLVVLDIDNTILEPRAPRATDQWFSAMVEHAKSIGYDYPGAVAAVLPMYYQAHATSRVHLVEPCGAVVIKDLCKKSLAVIALSSRSLDMIPHTKRQFSQLGINFTVSGIGRVRTEFSLHYGLVKFLEGVTYCGNNDKGQALLALLDRLNLNPKKIVFVDDKEKNLVTVKQAVERRKINFMGMRFSGCDAKVKAFVLDEKSKQLLAPCKKNLQSLTLVPVAG
jgi:FMN phosphatase YigB (HAD superfamily)